MSLDTQRVIDLAERVAQEINAIRLERGALTSLTTTDKTSIVNAINEMVTTISNKATINDSVTQLTTTYSSTKIVSEIASLIDDVLTASTQKTWSITKIQDEITAKLTNIHFRRKTVISIVDSNAAPPTMVIGDRYIIEDKGNGPINSTWGVVAQNDIVELDYNSNWLRNSPSEGWVVYIDDIDQDALFIDDGTPQWEVRTSTALQWSSNSW